MIYRGGIVKAILEKNLANWNYNKCRGCFFNRKSWIAFDNANGNCWVEEFKSLKMAICWLERLYEISEIKEFKALKIRKHLFFVPNIGFLKIQHKSNSLTSIFYPSVT